jgi:hypothetical protein
MSMTTPRHRLGTPAKGAHAAGRRGRNHRTGSSFAPVHPGLRLEPDARYPNESGGLQALQARPKTRVMPPGSLLCATGDAIIVALDAGVNVGMSTCISGRSDDRGKGKS